MGCCHLKPWTLGRGPIRRRKRSANPTDAGAARAEEELWVFPGGSRHGADEYAVPIRDRQRCVRFTGRRLCGWKKTRYFLQLEGREVQGQGFAGRYHEMAKNVGEIVRFEALSTPSGLHGFDFERVLRRPIEPAAL